jgi:hypothetical protein
MLPRIRLPCSTPLPLDRLVTDHTSVMIRRWVDSEGARQILAFATAALQSSTCASPGGSFETANAPKSEKCCPALHSIVTIPPGVTLTRVLPKDLVVGYVERRAGM